MKRLLPILLLAAAPLMAQQDVLTIASVAGSPGVVQVPIYLRDVAGSPLGIDRPSGSKIQGIAFRVTFSPAAAVSAASFTRGGVLAGLTPLYESVIQPAGGGGVAYVASFAEANNTIPFTNSPNGNLIGSLSITVANAAAPQIALAFEPALTALSNQSGSTIETVANGSLSLVAGLFAVSSGGDTRGDFTGDGKADLVWRNGPAGQAMLWTMDGLTVTGQANLPPASSEWRIVAVEDFNGDGRTDLLWQSSANAVAVWLMNGAAISSSALIASPPAAWQFQGAGDFNGDGRADVLLRNSDTSETVVWLMNGTAITGTATLAYPSPQWSVQGVGDLNGDARADILWRHSGTNDVWAWLMNGTTIAGTGYVASPPSPWQAEGVADFSGDGRADIVWRHNATNQVVVWLMNGSTITSSGFLAATPPSGWAVRAAVDFNGDGRSDLMWRNPDTGGNAVWLLNGATIQSSGFLPTVAAPWNVPGPR